MFIDTHAHIFMTVTERNIPLESIIDELHENQVDTVLDICGSEPELEYHQNVKETFLKNNINFYAAAGIHPQESSNFIDSDISCKCGKSAWRLVKFSPCRYARR